MAVCHSQDSVNRPKYSQKTFKRHKLRQWVNRPKQGYCWLEQGKLNLKHVSGILGYIGFIAITILNEPNTHAYKTFYNNKNTL